MNPKFVTAILAAAIAGDSLAQSDELVIKVANIAKRPVKGTILLLPGEKPLGTTLPNGELRLKRACAEGEQFKAVPEERSDYYDSKPALCSKLVELLVLPRPPDEQAIWGTQFFAAIPESKQFPRSVQLYGAILGEVQTTQIEVGAASGTDSVRCQVTMSRSFDISYLNTRTSKWHKVTPEVKLPDAPVVPQTTYIFPSPCAAAQPKIVDLKRDASKSLDATLKQYYLLNSPQIESAIATNVKKGNI